MGLLSIILVLMAGVGFLTFGFTQTVCGKPPNSYYGGGIGLESVVIHGYDYDMSTFMHPAVGPFNGNTNPLMTGGYNVAGNDISFMFQNVNQNCLGLITTASRSGISGSSDLPNWYFPCNAIPQRGALPPNETGYDSSYLCHVSSQARSLLTAMNPQGQVYYSWEDVAQSSNNFAVFESYVRDIFRCG